MSCGLACVALVSVHPPPPSPRGSESQVGNPKRPTRIIPRNANSSKTGILNPLLHPRPRNTRAGRFRKTCVSRVQVTLAAKSLVAEWAGTEGGWQEGGLKEWVLKVAQGEGGGPAGAALQRSMQVLGLTARDFRAALDMFPVGGAGQGGGERGVCLAAFWGMEVRREREGVLGLGAASRSSTRPEEGRDGEVEHR